MAKSKSVIIVGAGISGLSAARHLLKNGGFEVVVLEAETNHVGGRVYTSKFGQGTVEVGAQWVHGEEGNSIFDIANSNGFLNLERGNRKFGTDSFYVTQSGEFLEEGMYDKIVQLKGLLRNISLDDEELTETKLATCSIGEITTKAFWKFNEKMKLHEDKDICNGILDWIHRYQNNIDGADHWSDTSFIGQAQYKICPGNLTIPWKKNFSYSSVLDWILNDRQSQIRNEQDPKDLQEYSALETKLPSWIHLGKEVVKIQYNCDGSVCVFCKDGSDYCSDYLICTLPLGVLKEKQESLFKPPLPDEKVLAIQHLGFGTVDKIFLEFKSCWWPDHMDGLNLIWDSECNDNWIPNASDDILGRIDANTGLPVWTRSLLGFYKVFNQPNVLVTWITGKPAQFMERLDDEEIKRILTNTLKVFIGSVFEVSEPINLLRSKWHSNLFSRGSYSFRQISSETNNVWAAQLAEPLNYNDKPVLFFAGEHTHSNFYSTAHGAYDSGIREANRIIKHSTEKSWFSIDTLSLIRR